MGEALGAQCTRSPEKEIGKFPITLTQEGAGHAKVSHFGNTIDVAHWHSDMRESHADFRIFATRLRFYCSRRVCDA
jgi:GMP synthase (glutamine-hydrolysing)